MNIDWIVDNTTYSLDDRTNFYHLKYDGFAHAPLHRLSERGPLQDGDTDRGYRLDPRIVTLKMGIFGSSESDFYSKRHTLNTIFKASDTAGNLLFSYGSVERQLDCHCVEIAPGNRNHLWQEFVVSLKANDPTWYDPTQQFFYYGLAGGGDAGEIPMVVPMLVGASSINTSTTITNSGDVKTYPKVRFIGPITGAAITNNETGDKLDVAGTTVSAGDWLEIDCRYGYKTVVDQDGTNQIDTLTDDSDIATFSLEPSPEADGGVNSITVVGTGVGEASRIIVSYYNRYIGV
jgi:hypothetical protein